MIHPDKIEPSYPLRWPSERPRSQERKQALFRDGGRALTLTRARGRLQSQIGMMTTVGHSYRFTETILSTNIRFTASGARDQNVSRRDPDDPGVAFYFKLDRHPHVLACDRWFTVADNIAAIAAHIAALRGQERWGVADLRQAFAGHVAPPLPDPWWVILGITRDAPKDAVTAAYRKMAKTAHPDAGGNRAAWDKLNAAYHAARTMGDP